MLPGRQPRQLVGLVFLLQAQHQRVEIAFEDGGQVVQGQALDAVVGDPALRGKLHRERYETVAPLPAYAPPKGRQLGD